MSVESSDDPPDKFIYHELPRLALHYRREALEELERKCPWLKVFTSTQPDFNEARDHFFLDGSACILNLEKHIELMRLAIANEELTHRFGVEYIDLMAKLYTDISRTGHIEKVRSKELDERSEELSEDIQRERNAISKKSEPYGWMFPEDSFLKAGQQIITDYEPALPATPPVNLKKWISIIQESLKIEYYRADYTLTGILEIVKEDYKLPRFKGYMSNVKSFIYKVGCPEAHGNPEDNIVELRKLHATQMPFFAKLQDDLQAQIKLNNEQQEIITALVFRHLLENLPPGKTRANDTKSTPRWQEFWEDAARKELGKSNPDHPLHGLMHPKAITNSGAFSDGEKGHPFRTGKDLYGTLSEDIHRYKGGGQSGYVVRSDQWGGSVRRILQALIPKYFDDDGEVDWEEERKRYV